MANDRAERLFRDDFRQDDVVFSIRHRGARGSQTRSVGGVGVAGTSEVLALAFGVVSNGDRGIGHVVGFEVVSQVQFGGGTRLDADGRAIEFLGRGHAQLFLHHEALAVIVVHSHEIERQFAIAREGPGRVADQKVHFARSQRGETGFARGRHVFHFAGIAQNCGSNSLAERDVKALIGAICIRRAEAGQTGVRPADQFATCLDGLERRLRGSRASNHRGGRDDAEEYGFLHSYLFLSVPSHAGTAVFGP